MASNYGAPSSDSIVNDAYDRVCAVEIHTPQEFRREWRLALQNCKRLVGWRLVLAILQRSSSRFKKEAPWEMLLDQLMDVFDEMSFKMKETSPMVVTFFEMLKTEKIMAKLVSVDDDRFVRMGLHKFSRATVHVAREPSLRETIIHILCAMFNDTASPSVLQWIREEVSKKNEYVCEALPLALLSRTSTFSGLLEQYLVSIARVDEENTVPIAQVSALAACAAASDWYWDEQVVLSSVIDPLLSANDEDNILRGLALLGDVSNLPTPGAKHKKWREQYWRIYNKVKAHFASTNYGVRMWCVENAHRLGCTEMLEVRLGKETRAKIQHVIVDMIDRYGQIEWLYSANKKRDAGTLTLVLDCVLRHFNAQYLAMMQESVTERGNSAFVRMLDFLLIAWKNSGTEPLCWRENELERAIHLMLGEGLPYDQERLHLVANVAYCSREGKIAFRYLARWGMRARGMLHKVAEGKALPGELWTYAPRRRPPDIPHDHHNWHAKELQDEYVTFLGPPEFEVDAFRKRARPNPDDELQGLWRRFSLFLSVELVSFIIRFLMKAPPDNKYAHKRQEFFSFIVACRKMMFSLATAATIVEWSRSLVVLLEKCTEPSREDALLHGLSIMGKTAILGNATAQKPFGRSWHAKVTWLAQTYYRSHPKYVVHAMNLCEDSLNIRGTLETLCAPLEKCNHALALAGYIQSDKLKTIADKAAEYTGQEGGFKKWKIEISEEMILALGRGGADYCQLVAERGKKECGSLAAGLSLCWSLKKQQTIVNSTTMHSILRAILYYPDKMIVPVLRATESNTWAHSQRLVPLLAFFALSTNHSTVTKARMKVEQFRDAHTSTTDSTNLNILAHMFAFACTRLPTSLFEKGVEKIFIGNCSCPAMNKVIEFFIKALEWDCEMEIDRTATSNLVESPPASYTDALDALQAAIKRCGSKLAPVREMLPVPPVPDSIEDSAAVASTYVPRITDVSDHVRRVRRRFETDPFCYR